MNGKLNQIIEREAEVVHTVLEKKPAKNTT